MKGIFFGNSIHGRLLLVTVVALLASPLSAADWPQWRGPQRLRRQARHMGIL